MTTVILFSDHKDLGLENIDQISICLAKNNFKKIVSNNTIGSGFPSPILRTTRLLYLHPSWYRGCCA